MSGANKNQQNSGTKENGNYEFKSKFKDVTTNGSSEQPGVVNNKCYINVGDEDQMEIYGYAPSVLKTLLTWLSILLTCGILRLLFHWKPQWMLRCTHSRCELGEAKKVLLIDHYFQYFTENVVFLSQNWITLPTGNGTFEKVTSISYFDNKKVRYLWNEKVKEFCRLPGLDSDVNCTYFYEQNGLGADEQVRRQAIYGLNEIVVKVQSILSILYQEALEPFYIFQVFSLIIWTLDSYYYYAGCIVVMSGLSLTSSVIQTRRNQKQLHDTVQGSGRVSVCRGGDSYEEMESAMLVPGDVIEIPSQGCIMQCDAVLVSGNVIVNESMLTGESVPVTKTPLPHTSLQMLYNAKEHAKHTLFCGTKVIQTRIFNNAKVRAVVIRTGYQTAKGELVRSIMFPKPVDFKLNRHIHKFVSFLAGLALIGFIYTIVLKAKRGVHWEYMVIKALDLITIVIPPALPAAMTIGVVFAQSRLRKREIFCISPRAINISGCINCVCFDKTGTLTEDDLNFSEVVPVDREQNQFADPIHDPASCLDSTDPMLINLAACHSLSLIDGQIIGDPLDQKMFDCTKWILEEPEDHEIAPSIVRPTTGSNVEIGILRQFPFSSSLQRMSVIARQIHHESNEPEFELYVKGSPEIIESLCLGSSIPVDFSTRLHEYTEKGYRVLGLAYRPLSEMNHTDVQRAAREDLEKELTFIGLLVMGNMLKPETTAVIETLIMANIRPVMVTGDNMLTALSVARQCSMIPPWHKVVLLEVNQEEKAALDDPRPQLCWKYANDAHESLGPSLKLVTGQDQEARIHVAITGKTFEVLREHYPEMLKKVAIRGTVFSRMAPEQKQQLIELLQELGYYVGMCGDGANDCGALKAAHAGVSLSETEASVASPFTSKQPNISCIPTLIQEGRASIVTAFGILKYMACYSLTQFISVIILYTFYSNLTDKQFLYIDLCLITLFVTLFGRNKAFTPLNRKPPPSSLIGLIPLSSILLQIGLVLIMQIVVIVIAKAQPWYREHVTENVENDLASHDNYSLFAFSVFQYITLAVVFSKGRPYRRPLYTNRLFSLALILMTGITIYLVIYPPDPVAEFFEFDIADVPISFRILMVLLALAHCFLALLLESFIVDFIMFKKFKRWFASLKRSKLPFEGIDKETRTSTLWLPNSFNLTTSL